MRHGVRHARGVARMCRAREVTARERQMGHEQASQQSSKATEHESKLSVDDKVREVSLALSLPESSDAIKEAEE